MIYSCQFSAAIEWEQENNLILNQKTKNVK